METIILNDFIKLFGAYGLSIALLIFMLQRQFKEKDDAVKVAGEYNQKFIDLLVQILPFIDTSKINHEILEEIKRDIAFIRDHLQNNKT